LVDLVGAAERLVDPPDDVGHAGRRVEALVGIHLAREVGVAGHLPAAHVDGLQAGLDLLDGLVPGRGPERADVAAAGDQLAEPLGAEPCQRVLDGTLPRSRSTSSFP
jgi:hypothetical protein